MTTVAFLTPTTGEQSACSPMLAASLAAGAQLEARDGWQVAVSYGAPVAERALTKDTVAFVDRCRLPKYLLPGDPVAKFGLATQDPDGGWRCPVNPTRTLVIGPSGLGAAAPAGAAALDVTCAYALIALVGPLAGECLARFCALDVRESKLPVGGFAPGSVARTPGFVLRDGESSLLVGVGWAFGQYLFSTVAQAARSLGGGPAGEDALDA